MKRKSLPKQQPATYYALFWKRKFLKLAGMSFSGRRVMAKFQEVTDQPIELEYEGTSVLAVFKTRKLAMAYMSNPKVWHFVKKYISLKKMSVVLSK